MLVMTCYLVSILLSAYFCYETVTQAPEASIINLAELIWVSLYLSMITGIIVFGTKMTAEVRNRLMWVWREIQGERIKG